MATERHQQPGYTPQFGLRTEKNTFFLSRPPAIFAGGFLLAGAYDDGHRYRGEGSAYDYNTGIIAALDFNGRSRPQDER